MKCMSEQLKYRSREWFYFLQHYYELSQQRIALIRQGMETKTLQTH